MLPLRVMARGPEKNRRNNQSRLQENLVEDYADFALLVTICQV